MRLGHVLPFGDLARTDGSTLDNGRRVLVGFAVDPVEGDLLADLERHQARARVQVCLTLDEGGLAVERDSLERIDAGVRNIGLDPVGDCAVDQRRFGVATARTQNEGAVGTGDEVRFVDELSAAGALLAHVQPEGTGQIDALAHFSRGVLDADGRTNCEVGANEDVGTMRFVTTNCDARGEVSFGIGLEQFQV